MATPPRLFKYVLDKLRVPSGGVQIDSSWVPAPPLSSVPSLLVYARQDTPSSLVSGVSTLIPFSAEVIDNGGIFSDGYFTPDVTGVYRVDCNIYLEVGSGQIGTYLVNLFQGEDQIETLLWIETYVPGLVDSGHIPAILTAGVPYHVRGYCGGSDPSIGGGP